MLSYDGFEIRGLREIPKPLTDPQALLSFSTRSFRAEDVEVKPGSVIQVTINGETVERIVESIACHGDSVEVTLVPWGSGSV